MNARGANDTPGVDADPVRALQRKLYRAAKQSRSRRFHALFDKVHRRDFLWRAWGEVARNRGAAGIDGETIEVIEAEGVEVFLDGLAVELREGCYRPLPVRRVTIPKRSGGQRHLGVPAVRDRVVQAAVRLVLEPIFEADFVPVSFGFRPKRSAHQARERIRDGIGRGHRWVVDADITGFFDNLDHDLLLAMVRERVSDRRVVGLVAGWLRSGVLAGASVLRPETGTSQGGVISPLLANVYLNRLDRAWQAHHRRLGELTRYADDLVIVCGTRQRAEAALVTLHTLLAELGLELAAAKTRVVELRKGEEGFDFLGYHYRIMPTRRNRARMFVACWPSKASVTAAKERVRALVPYSRVGRPTIMVVSDLNAFLRGWGAYYRQGNSTHQFKALDRFVQERLARFVARKHGSRNWRRGLYELLKSETMLGLVHLAGTVRYPTAHAAQ